jgi:hypothetical protein
MAPAKPGLRPGLGSARPVQIKFERCLGSATTLSLQRPSPFCHHGAQPRDLRCAIRVSRSYRPTTSTNHDRILMEKPTSPLSFRVSRSGPRNRRSLGFARDDKKERVVARKGWLLNRGIFQAYLDRSEVQPSLRGLDFLMVVLTQTLKAIRLRETNFSWSTAFTTDEIGLC